MAPHADKKRDLGARRLAGAHGRALSAPAGATTPERLSVQHAGGLDLQETAPRSGETLPQTLAYIESLLLRRALDSTRGTRSRPGHSRPGVRSVGWPSSWGTPTRSSRSASMRTPLPSEPGDLGFADFSAATERTVPAPPASDEKGASDVAIRRWSTRGRRRAAIRRTEKPRAGHGSPRRLVRFRWSGKRDSNPRPSAWESSEARRSDAVLRG